MTDTLWIIFGSVGVIVVVAIAAVIRGRVLSGGGRSAGPRPVAAEPVRWERKRQKAVDALRILDTPAEDRFDRIVTMARQLYSTESAVFAVTDRDRDWHKSRSGNTRESAPRSSSFCSVTIRGAGSLVIGDASKDDRFSALPGVLGNPNVRFYAGFPVRSPNGQQIGALCVYDPTPRDAAEVDDSMLEQLAHLLEAELRVAPVPR